MQVENAVVYAQRVYQKPIEGERTQAPFEWELGVSSVKIVMYERNTITAVRDDYKMYERSVVIAT